MDATHEGYPVAVLGEGTGLEAMFAPGVGMVGCSLRHRGDELLAQRGGLARYDASGSTFGIPLLHPWANRLAAFDYEAAGTRVEIDPGSQLVRRDPNGLPIHGALSASPHWQVVEQSGDRLAAELDYGAHPDLLAVFPFPHVLRIDARVSDGALAIDTTLRATGDTPVPVSFGYHPYLQLPGVRRSDWLIELPVRSHLQLDEQFIPTGDSVAVEEPRAPLGERAFDDGYADLLSPAVFALEGGGRRIEVRFGDGYPFAQVFSPADQELICFEPMTAPTNALRTGDGLRLVDPGSSFSAGFEIRVTDT